ncbi:MAG: hypothetical protein P1T08_16005 [Acidimicrobiia bacterium]|nr:hypothetical protein [Acidimicrobiia bacterium]
MTLSTAQGIFVLAALAVGSGLWAAQVTVNTTTRGPDWAMNRLPDVFRWSLVAGALGILVALLAEPGWIGLGVTYLAGVVAWTARSVARAVQRIQDAGAYEPLPVDRQAVMVGRVGFWLLAVAALGIGVAVIDIESRGGVAAWDLLLVGLVAAAGVMYRRRATALSGNSEPVD